MNFEEVRDLESRFLIPTYERLPILAVRGEGCVLYDQGGKAYVDFLGGIAVNALGYSHPEILQVLHDESESLLHVSNLIYHPFQGALAQKLAQWTGLDRAFFANSGTEAVEGAIKLARAYARKRTPGGNQNVILAVENSFHGRTLGALSATWPAKYREPFEPLLPSVRFVPANNPAALRKAFTKDVAGFMVEPIQGEGGVAEMSAEFLKTGEELCRKHGALFVCDEIQCGLGRTGRYFAFQRFGLKPDVVLVAKPLAAGLPLAAIVARESAAQAFSPGMHGTTFGGGPLQCRLALKVLEIIDRPGFLGRVKEMGAHFRQKLEELQSHVPAIREVRGDGLILGIELKSSGKRIVGQMLEAGFLINCTHDTVLRFLPPLIIERSHIDSLVEALRPCLAGLAQMAVNSRQEVLQ
jgi:acetylornithine/N-succinyldiaminopimelate aminotransferase